jgi:hypothetical protein
LPPEVLSIVRQSLRSGETEAEMRRKLPSGGLGAGEGRGAEGGQFGDGDIVEGLVGGRVVEGFLDAEGAGAGTDGTALEPSGAAFETGHDGGTFEVLDGLRAIGVIEGVGEEEKFVAGFVGSGFETFDVVVAGGVFEGSLDVRSGLTPLVVADELIPEGGALGVGHGVAVLKVKEVGLGRCGGGGGERRGNRVAQRVRSSDGGNRRGR